MRTAVRRIEADHLLDLGGDPLRLGRRQVDLVEDGDDLVAVVDGEIGVGEGLRLDPCVASTTSSEPSQAASDRLTS